MIVDINKITGTLHKSLILIAVLGSQYMVSGQSLDSLEIVLRSQDLAVDERVKIFLDLSLKYIDKDPSRSLELGREGLDLAKGIDDARAEAGFLYRLGSAHYRTGQYDSSAIYLKESMDRAKKMKAYEIEAPVHITYGKLYRRESKHTAALDHYQKAITIYQGMNDLEGLGAAYIGIGGTYHLMKNHDQALPYYEKAEKLALQINDKVGLARAYLSLSSLYSRIGDDKDKCIFYAKEAAKLCRENGDYLSENDALQTVAHVYFLHDDYDSALPYAQEAVDQAERLGNPRLLAYSLIVLSNILYQQGAYKRCVDISLKVLEHDSTDTDLKMNVYANLSKGYAHLGSPDLTEAYMDRYHEVLAEYSNESYQNSLSEMEVKYETEQKESRIGNLVQQRKFYIWLGIAAALILLIALGLAIIRYRLAVSKRKLAEQESKRLEQEKQLVAVQATLDGEAAERTRLAKDLHDGLGSMLSVVKFNLPQIKGDAILEAVDVSRFQKALGMLDESIQELRRVAHHIMPESLLRYGLKVSLTDFSEAIPMVSFHYFGNEMRLSEKLEIMVYRCIHELVNNALKHAQADHINVQLVQEVDRLSFTVQDDGKGFDPNTAPEGMGLRNIRQRVEAFQGKISIYSSQQGTEIHVELGLINNGKND